MNLYRPEEHPFPEVAVEEDRPSVCAEFVALLQRLRDSETERQALQREVEEAADSVWCRVTVALHELERGLRTAGGAVEPGVEALGARLAQLREEQQIELLEADGEPFDELPPGLFEILSFRPQQDGERERQVVETFRPAISRRGRLLQVGKVVIATSDKATGASS